MAGIAGNADGPWNPGIGSALTRELLALSSIFRPENVTSDLRQAVELRDVTGLDLEDLAVFRPERLAVHELLVRVTADYEVPDAEDASIDSLGINLRRMVETLVKQVIEPSRSELSNVYQQLRAEIGATVRSEVASAFENNLANVLEEPKQAAHRRHSWFRKPENAPVPSTRVNDWERDERISLQWATRAQSTEVPLHGAALRSLAKVAASIRSRHGRIVGERTFLASVATDLACNEFGSEIIGKYLESKIWHAANEAGFRRLPVQSRPVVMVIKGASASGKSTMRPLQRKLAARMALYWGDFALISPDIWRKLLLDYGSLGRFHKYAGMLTSQELAIIDRKLDAYVTRKNDTRRSSHLLIDRFRFGSFSLDSDENRNLYRFRELSCYFFMVTPPEETVERAWRRGLRVGRFKAVDDLLFHNIEAFTGLENILLSRTLDPATRLHYELLDNSVPHGEAPRTIAFGWSGEMNILDVGCMVNIERYRKININAKSPEEVYPDRLAMAVGNNVDFLVHCLRRYPQLNFADRITGRIYASYVSGHLESLDYDELERAAADGNVRSILDAAAPEIFSWQAPQSQPTPKFLQPSQYHTIGTWMVNN